MQHDPRLNYFRAGFPAGRGRIADEGEVRRDVGGRDNRADRSAAAPGPHPDIRRNAPTEDESVRAKAKPLPEGYDMYAPEEPQVEPTDERVSIMRRFVEIERDIARLNDDRERTIEALDKASEVRRELVAELARIIGATDPSSPNIKVGGTISTRQFA